jgi:hypothetical protein
LITRESVQVVTREVAVIGVVVVATRIGITIRILIVMMVLNHNIKKKDTISLVVVKEDSFIKIRKEIGRVIAIIDNRMVLIRIITLKHRREHILLNRNLLGNIQVIRESNKMKTMLMMTIVLYLMYVFKTLKFDYIARSKEEVTD